MILVDDYIPVFIKFQVGQRLRQERIRPLSDSADYCIEFHREFGSFDRDRAAPASCIRRAEFIAHQNRFSEPPFFVTDKFDNVYVEAVETNGSGEFVMDFTKYPESLFTADSGFFEMTVSESSAFSTDETLTFDGNFYNCIIFSFVNTITV